MKVVTKSLKIIMTLGFLCLFSIEPSSAAGDSNKPSAEAKSEIKATSKPESKSTKKSESKSSKSNSGENGKGNTKEGNIKADKTTGAEKGTKEVKGESTLSSPSPSPSESPAKPTFSATTSATATPSSDPSFNSASCYSSQFFYGGGSFG